MADGLLTVAEAARRLGLSRGTVYVMTQRGQLSRVRAGYRDLIPAAQVDALLRVQQFTEAVGVGAAVAMVEWLRTRPDLWPALPPLVRAAVEGGQHR
jgi:excisionase family DNA binding protein